LQPFLPFLPLLAEHRPILDLAGATMSFDFAAYEAARTATRVGRAVVFVERAASTMDLARDGAAAGGALGTAYVAGEQSAGRGRQGRTWLSAASAGLYATYHLHTAEAPGAPLYALAGGLAASDAILQASGLVTALKWPNDVLVGTVASRKVAGVLAESRPASTGGLDIFLGIGINMRAIALPPELVDIATSIEGAGAPPPPLEPLLAALSNALERWSTLIETRPADLIEAWKGRLLTLGQRVRLQTPAGPVEGDAVDVTPRGELVLRRGDGHTDSFAAGDVSTLR
jgi:BirA family transcriptional regulator, biotin operon repressor / biotin---[acetyl-CoA-carboxylase] ligase